MPRKSRPALAPSATRVVGYIRVSTEEQRNGPEAQREALAAWCARNGAELVAVHEDRGVSGGAALDKRLGLLAAVDSLSEHGAGLLLVAKRDRLARDVMVAAMVERMAARVGARVQSADGAGDGEGPEALLMRRMIDAFAEYERAIIRARTRAALASKKGRGELTGTAPVGTRRGTDGVHLEADPAEAEAVAMIRELKAAGLSVRGIAAQLEARGVPCRGGRWHPTTVARVLRRVAA